MTKCEALMIGGSAGSLEVLLKMLPGLDPALPFPVIIVLHRMSGKDSILTDLLAAKTQLRVKEVDEKDTLEPSTIYIAPPNYHLLIENNRTFSLDASEKVNFSRPSLDVSFESAADVFGKNMAGLLLSGANSDGTAGLKIIAQQGGKVLVQNPLTAVVNYMPAHALEQIEADAILTPDEMPGYINSLTN
ncbi:chemotaxis protein CheB [Chryseobacterium sp. cx-311]|uniref:chemotaxis protein CheB n=1 Tax=Marnyiella aurantia TaxID=2758037 RepID=UPI001AE31047|nr:chemotaxis protein CheB [Marnyiella aurantia]MBP0611431.1 chemotaxis protein CheB [Marnyiella aurantia]